MVTTSALSAASATFFLSLSIVLNSMGCGGKPKRFGQSETPASKSTLTSGVSTKVHMDLTPKLSAAKGVTLILSSIWLTFPACFGQHQSQREHAFADNG